MKHVFTILKLLIFIYESNKHYEKKYVFAFKK